MDSPMKTPSLRLVSMVLALALISCFIFSLKIYNDFVTTKKTLTAEKNRILKELNISKDSLEIAISENSSLKTELIIERQKVSNLIDEIEGNTLDVSTLLKYKAELNRLKNVVAVLQKDKKDLALRNDLLKIQRDSTILVLSNAKSYNEKLAHMNEHLHKNVKKGSKISVINLKTIPYRQKSVGKMELTDKASKVDVLQVVFTVVGSKITRAQDKEYYVQIIDESNHVMGDIKKKSWGTTSIEYSYEVPVKFYNESMEVTADLEMINLKKGNYFVSVFDKDELASKTSFALN